MKFTDAVGQYKFYLAVFALFIEKKQLVKCVYIFDFKLHWKREFLQHFTDLLLLLAA